MHTCMHTYIHTYSYNCITQYSCPAPPSEASVEWEPGSEGFSSIILILGVTRHYTLHTTHYTHTHYTHHTTTHYYTLLHTTTHYYRLLHTVILTSIGDFPETLSQAILVTVLVGIMLVGRLGVLTGGSEASVEWEPGSR